MLNEIEVIETNPNQKHWKDFIALPQSIYNAQQLQISAALNFPLKQFITAFVAFQNGIVQARLILYETNFKETNNTVCFGAFEALENEIAVKKLFEEVVLYLKNYPYKNLVGPMNGSTWENYRIAIEWPSSPFFSETYNPTYYAQLLNSCGFKSMATYFSHLQTDISYDKMAIAQMQDLLTKAKVVIRQINLADFESEIALLYPFISLTFANNYLYSPIEFNDFKEKYLLQKKWLDAMFVFVAENESKEIVGLVLGFPDYLDNKKETIIVKTVARNPDKKYAGIAHVLCSKIADACLLNGYKQIVHAFMHHDNRSVKLSGFFYGEKLREYALFSKNLL